MSERQIPSGGTIVLLLVIVLLWAGSGKAQEKKLESFNIAYTSATPTRAPLWIAKETGLFEKHGLDARLIYIRAGSPSISALVSGDVHVSSDPAAAAAIAAARGASIVVVGTYGLASYRLGGASRHNGGTKSQRQKHRQRASRQWSGRLAASIPAQTRLDSRARRDDTSHRHRGIKQENHRHASRQLRRHAGELG